MEVVRGHLDVPAHLRGAVVALGNFDGVHRGHREVIGLTRSLAKEAGAPSGVISFHPHPRRFFSPDQPFFRLTPQPLKLRLIEALGVDVVFVVGFDAALARMTPEEFIAEVIVGKLGASHVVAGWDFRFGVKRAGDATLLGELGQAHGIGVTIVRPQADSGGEPFSSTRVRQLLAEGRPREAAEILGYRWRLVETVIGGDRRGGELGFPTINMRLDPGIDLAHGIYAVRVTALGETHGGAAYHGTRPTFGGAEPALEAYLFDFAGDLYGREVEIEFVDYLRADRTFETVEELRRQIALDCEAARAVLAALEPDDPLRPRLPPPETTHAAATSRSAPWRWKRGARGETP